MKKGFTLIELLIVVAIIAILAAIAVPNFLEAQVRSKVSRVQADQRSMATALASYYVDNNGYPLATICGGMGTGNCNSVVGNVLLPGTTRPTVATSIPGLGGAAGSTATNRGRPTFAISVAAIGTPGGFSSLTTPISYITSYFNDPFSNAGQTTFTYLPDGPGFLLVSYGPDADEGSAVANFRSLVASSVTQFSTPVDTPFNGRAVATSKQTLRTGAGAGAGTPAFTYDPTNGTTSIGDVYRISD
jgi:prepilin-type N-terminal cleavage/methylation domain-containing protein